MPFVRLSLHAFIAENPFPTVKKPSLPLFAFDVIKILPVDTFATLVSVAAFV